MVLVCERRATEPNLLDQGLHGSCSLGHCSLRSRNSARVQLHECVCNAGVIRTIVRSLLLLHSELVLQLLGARRLPQGLSLHGQALVALLLLHVSIYK